MFRIHHSALGVLLLARTGLWAMKMFPNMSIIFSLESVLVTSTTHQTTARHHVTGQFHLINIVRENMRVILVKLQVSGHSLHINLYKLLFKRNNPE